MAFQEMRRIFNSGFKWRQKNLFFKQNFVSIQTAGRIISEDDLWKRVLDRQQKGVVRIDDNLESFVKRMNILKTEVFRSLELFEQQNMLYRLDASKKPQDIDYDFIKFLKEKQLLK